MSILIVDDSKVIQVLLGTTLKKAGYTDLHFLSSAEECFDFFGLYDDTVGAVAGNVDLILMDIVMPVIDGIEATRRIKEEAHLKDIPVIMVTAKDESEVLQMAFAAGAVDYIVKPVKKQELLARVRSVLRLKHEMDRRKSREKELLEVTRQLEEANRTLQRFSYMDGLTSVSNRRYFDDTLKKEWKRAMREKTFISLIMLDIDFFKAYNDYYGHQGGDECLKQVAVMLSDAIKRASDFVARYGWEEFVLVLPNTNLEGAITVAENVKKELAALHLKHERSSVSDQVTVSMGIASSKPGKGSEQDNLVRDADRALYRAKSEGRDQIKFSPDNP
ncbi:MAG: diguanylate cyclase [Proteobacteria bacterium]|nr:diguanylate cyclase [Pseudomonadota bacterium]